MVEARSTAPKEKSTCGRIAAAAHGNEILFHMPHSLFQKRRASVFRAKDSCDRAGLSGSVSSAAARRTPHKHRALAHHPAAIRERPQHDRAS